MEALTYLTDKTARHTLLLGGARSGKTFLIVRVMLLRALLYPQLTTPQPPSTSNIC